MRTNFIEAIVGALVLAVAGLFLVFAYRSGVTSTPTEGITINANFDRIDGLVVGNDVMVSGVKIGEVLSITLNPQTYLAHVTVTIQKGLNLPSDTSAEILSQSLLGGKYVALVPGGSDKLLSEGGTIQYTQSAVNLENLLGQFLFSTSGANSEEKKKEHP